MMGTGMMGGFGLIGLLLILVIFVGVIIGVLFLVTWLVRRTSADGSTSFNQSAVGQSPQEILQTRYARGEITREQYELMKQDLS